MLVHAPLKMSRGGTKTKNIDVKYLSVVFQYNASLRLYDINAVYNIKAVQNSGHRAVMSCVIVSLSVLTVRAICSI